MLKISLVLLPNIKRLASIQTHSTAHGIHVMPGIKAHKSLKINTQNNGTPHTDCRVTDHMLFQVYTGQLGSLFCLHVPSTGVWITMFKYSCWLTKMCLRSHKFAMLIRYLPVLWRFTWDQTLLEGVCVLVRSYSCTYFLTGSSVTVTVVRVSHGPDSEPPQRVTLGPAWSWTRDLSGSGGHKPDIKPLDMHSPNLEFIGLPPPLLAHLRIKFLSLRKEWQSIKVLCKKLFYRHLLTFTTWMSCITLCKTMAKRSCPKTNKTSLPCWLFVSLGPERTELAGWEPW